MAATACAYASIHHLHIVSLTHEPLRDCPQPVPQVTGGHSALAPGLHSQMHTCM